MEHNVEVRRNAGAPTDSNAQISSRLASEFNSAEFEPMRELEKQLGLQVGFLDIKESRKSARSAEQKRTTNEGDANAAPSDREKTRPSQNKSRADYAPYFQKDERARSSYQDRSTQNRFPERAMPYYQDRSRPNDRADNSARSAWIRQQQIERQQQEEQERQRQEQEYQRRNSPEYRHRQSRAALEDTRTNRPSQSEWKKQHDSWLEYVKKRSDEARYEQTRPRDSIQNNRLLNSIEALNGRSISDIENGIPDASVPAASVAMIIERAYGFEIRKNPGGFSTGIEMIDRRIKNSFFGIDTLEKSLLNYGWREINTSQPAPGDIVIGKRTDGSEDAGIYSGEGMVFGADSSRRFSHTNSNRFQLRSTYERVAVYRKIN